MKVQNVTKSMLDEAVEAILEGGGKLIEQVKNELRTEISSLRSELKSDIRDTRSELKSEIGFVKDEINGLKAEFSTTPSRKEFEEVKRKVNDLN